MLISIILYHTPFISPIIAQENSSGEYYQFVKKFGSEGEGAGEFIIINGIDVDSKGNVYVIDNAMNKIQKFDNNGTFIEGWGTYGISNGEFVSIRDIAIDSHDNIYVVDSDANRIQKFDSNGNFVEKWGSAHSLIVEGLNVKIPWNGTFIEIPIENFEEQSQIKDFDTQYSFSTPTGIAIDGLDNVFVVDYDDNSEGIQKFDNKGNFINKWNIHHEFNGNSNGGLISADSDGNVYVIDYLNRIQKFDSNGTFITMWGSKGDTNGKFHFPLDITTDLYNNVYVSDSFENRIQKFDNNGAFINMWNLSIENGGYNNAGNMAVDISERIFIANGGDIPFVEIFDRNKKMTNTEEVSSNFGITGFL
jgi:streptogramin lyase